MSTESGRLAEARVAEWLGNKGYQILDRNWRTRWCELDIVAEKAGAIHVVEVKYRRRSDWGTGFDYITADKARRLQRAAQAWLQENGSVDRDWQIDVVAADDQKIDLIENAISVN